MKFKKEDFVKFDGMYGPIYWSKKHYMFFTAKSVRKFLNVTKLDDE